MSRLPRQIRSTVLLTLFLLAAETMTYAQIADDAARGVILDHEQRIRPLEIAAGRAWWDANVTGKDEDFAAKEETQNQLDAALADRGRFAELKATQGEGRADKTRCWPARSTSSTCSTSKSRSIPSCSRR